MKQKRLLGIGQEEDAFLNGANEKSTMVMSELLILYMGEARMLHNKIKNLYNSFIVDEGT